MLDPLRFPDALIAKYILQKTPIGTEFNKAIEMAELICQKVEIISPDFGFYHQGIYPNKIIGSMSIQCMLGQYLVFPFRTTVTVFWGFDSNGALIDVWVWKTSDGL